MRIWSAGEQGLAEVMEQTAVCFGRVELRWRALANVRGLLALVERKNDWQLTEAAGDRTPDGMQDFVARAPGEAERVRAYVVAHLGEGQAMLVLDETGFLKKGDKSCGVQRQHSDTVGRIECCQVGVFSGDAGCHGQTLLGRALCLPQSWTHALAWVAAADVPETIAFATKSLLAYQRARFQQSPVIHRQQRHDLTVEHLGKQITPSSLVVWPVCP
jgi:SRSO17 transposase